MVVGGGGGRREGGLHGIPNVIVAVGGVLGVAVTGSCVGVDGGKDCCCCEECIEEALASVFLVFCRFEESLGEDLLGVLLDG